MKELVLLLYLYSSTDNTHEDHQPQSWSLNGLFVLISSQILIMANIKVVGSGYFVCWEILYILRYNLIPANPFGFGLYGKKFALPG